MVEYVDDTAAKIVLAASDGDSIRRIAQKIDGTYSWVHTWIEHLEEIGVVERNDGVYVTASDVREGYAQIVEAIARQTAPTVAEAYVVPHFAQVPFAYTKIDAVYVWTHGGYQIARGDDAYPIFMRVRDADIERWETIEYMREYRWNFEPALEMIADEYEVDIDVDRPHYAAPE